LFGSIAAINSLNASFIYWYGAFIFIYVFSLTELMDRNKMAIIWEFLKTGLGLGLIFWQEDWFGLSTLCSPSFDIYNGLPIIFSVQQFLVLSKT